MSKPALHFVNLPHTSTIKKYVACSYTEKGRKICTMMKNLGYPVYLYGGPENEADVTEHIVAASAEQQLKWFGEHDFHKNFFNISWGPNDTHWVEMNNKAIEEIRKRIKPRDIICLIAGHCQKQIADAFPEHLVVEYGIGYYGHFANFKVFESYSHMHHCYGKMQTDSGGFYDAVIHNYFDPDDFYLGDGSGDYLLWMGRFISTKGPEIAVEVAKRLGMPLIMAGQGAVQKGKTVSAIDGGMSFTSDLITHIGHVDVEQRAKLMAEAKATLMPTTYIEPFGGVSIESMMSGTPVVASDYGVFTETTRKPVGARFRTIGEAVDATRRVMEFDRAKIREHAVENYSMDVAALKYDMYFEQLGTLYEGRGDKEDRRDGFYSDWYPKVERFENA